MRPAAPSDPPPRFVDTAGGPAAYRDEGEGPTYVAIHGAPGSSRDFRWLAPAVGSRGRFLRLDLPGFGDTPPWAGDTVQVEGGASAVAAFLDALDLEDVTLVGHSLGGVLSVAAAHLRPERVRALALVASPGPVPHRNARRVPAKPLRRIIDLPGAERWLAPLTRQCFRWLGFRGDYAPGALPRTIRMAAAIDYEEHGRRAEQLRIPCAMFWSKDDPIVEVGMQHRLAELLPAGPRQEFDDGGHNPQKHHAVEIAKTLMEVDQWPAPVRRAPVPDGSAEPPGEGPALA